MWPQNLSNLHDLRHTQTIDFRLMKKNPIHNVRRMVGATTKKSKNNKFICIKVIKLNRMKHGTIKKTGSRGSTKNTPNVIGMEHS